VRSHVGKQSGSDEDEWLDFFREYLCGHPELAEHVARIWFALLEHLGRNSNTWRPEGVQSVRFILNQAARGRTLTPLTYPFTRSDRSPVRLPGHTNSNRFLLPNQPLPAPQSNRFLLRRSSNVCSIRAVTKAFLAAAGH